MFDLPISLPSVCRTSAAATRSRVPAKKAAAPKTDVIDLSRPPAPEQAERMRGTAATHVTVEYQYEYCDVTVGIAYRSVYSSVSAGTYTSSGYAFVEATTQMGCTREDGSYWEATLHECAYSAKLSGHSAWYIPQRLNEDGSWSLAEYGPSAQFTVSGYHSIFSFTQSDGEQTRTFWSETFVGRVRGTIPGGPIPDGAMPLPFPGDRDLLDRLDRLADRLRSGFDARA